MTSDTPSPIASFVPHVSWRGYLPSLPRPVIALPGRELYLVLLEGRGFSWAVPGNDGPLTGFLTYRIVASATVRDACEKASASVHSAWRRNGYARAVGPLSSLTPYQIEALPHRFRFNSTAGLVFLGPGPTPSSNAA